MILGVIADDFTGATDVASMLVRAGMSTVQVIGVPVGDALMAALDATQTIACPALPENGRTIFKGHLFVGDALLSDSSMRDHPLTPMRDANLVHVLQAQTPRTVGLTAYNTVGLGAEAIQA